MRRPVGAGASRDGSAEIVRTASPERMLGRQRSWAWWLVLFLVLVLVAGAVVLGGVVVLGGRW